MIKKITLSLFVSLLFGYSLIKAQPGVTPIYPYSQNFDTFLPFQSVEGQSGWLNGNFFGAVPSDVSIYLNRGIDSTLSMSINLSDNISYDSILTPYIGDLVATTQFSFYYRVVNAAFNAPHTLGGDGGLKVSILPYSGPVAEPETELYRISSLNHTDSVDYVKVVLDLDSSYAGKTAYFKFSFYQGNLGDNFYIDIDSIEINHPTIVTSTFNVNKNRFKVYTNENNKIYISGSINNSAEVAVYNIEGKQMFNTNFNGNLCIDAYHWPKGIYFIGIGSAQNFVSHKIVIR